MGSPAGYTITEHDPRKLSDDEIAELNDFGNVMKEESRPEDPPTPVDVAIARQRNTPTFLDVWGFAARTDAGELVGLAEGVVMRTGDNEHILEADVRVRADHRRKGLAKALLSGVAQVAEREGRRLLLAFTSDRVPAGAEFARCVGAEPGVEGHVNRLLLAEVDRALVDKWVEEGPRRAPGYSLLTVDGVVPDNLVDQVVKVLDVMNSQPFDDLEIEDHHFTVGQLREGEKAAKATKSERWWLFARHDASGELAGLTDVSWSPSLPKTVNQGNTGVDAAHRGHALGKWLKAAMLQRILDERPDVEDVRTTNANSNEAMLGINSQLGFKPYIANAIWQVPLDEVQAYLASSA